MKCTKCNKNVSEDSLFCEHCGAKIEKEKIEEKDEAQTKNGNDVKKQIIDHLEFLGYELKATDATGGYIGTHANRSNLWLSFKDNGVSFVAFYTIDGKKVGKNKEKVHEYINKMNNGALLVSFSIPDDLSRLICGSWYPMTYTKKSFANFIELFENDIRRSFQLEGLMSTLT